MTKKDQNNILLRAFKFFLLGTTATFIFLCLTDRPPEDSYVVAIIGILSAGLAVATVSDRGEV